MSLNLGLIDYGMGNLHSVEKCLERLDQACSLIQNADDLEGVDRLEVLWTLHWNCLFAKPFEGFPHRVEIAHAVIDHTEIQAQSINPFDEADASEILRNCA